MRDTQVGEFADRQPVQAEPHHVVGFLGPFDDLLQLGENMAVEEPEQRPIHLQCVDTGKAGRGEQCEDTFQWPQGALRSHPEWCRQRSGDQERHHVWVFARQLAEIVCEGPQGSSPVRIGGVSPTTVEHHLDHPVEHGCLVGHMPVEHHRVATDRLTEAAHGQSVYAVTIDDRQRTRQYRATGDRTAFVVFLVGVGRVGGLPGTGWSGRRLGHRLAPDLG